MSDRTSLATRVLLAAALAVLQFPLYATTYRSPFFAPGVLQQGDTLRSGDDCTELSFHFADGYYNRLDLRGSGGGCGDSHWDSYSDFDWQSYGAGFHSSAREPRGIRAARAQMQHDGNFVIYDLADGFPQPVWATNTDGNPGAYLNVQGDGNMVIYSAGGAVLWSLF